MSAEPSTPEPDTKDWTWVLQEPCPDCGYDPAALAPADVAGRTLDCAAAFTAALAEPGAGVRPDPQVWSTLEYSCHVRDVCRIFAQRAQLMLAEDDPQFANWDQDETAVAERYWEQDPTIVATELSAAAETVAATFASVAGDQWERTGRRSNGSVFTVGTLGLYFLHDLVHHQHDIGR